MPTDLAITSATVPSPLDVRPSESCHYLAYAGGINSVLPSKSCVAPSTRRVFLSYFSHLFFSESVDRGRFPFLVRPSSFCNGVLAIILLSTKKQMVRVATWAIIAFVKYTQSIWYRPSCKRPRQPVCWPVLAQMTELPVTCRERVRGPSPTFVWISFFWKIGPKSLFCGPLHFPRLLSKFSPFISLHGKSCPLACMNTR